MSSTPSSTPTIANASDSQTREPQRPDFRIGNVPVYGRVSLAPMAGFSDSPYRSICRRMGAAFSYTEFISAEGIRRGWARSIDLFRYRESERPLIFQIFGNNARDLLHAVQVAEELGPDVIDINMGCSVRAVAHKGSGAGMLLDLPRTARIMELLARNLRVPLTAKIRLGWDDRERRAGRYLEIARALEDSGVAMLSVHGRVKMQAYKGEADWDAIGEIKARAGIPVLGNGDVQSPQEAAEKMERYGADGVLIGRAAVGDPWIFSGRSGRGSEPERILRLARIQMEEMLSFYADRGNRLHLFRKHLSRYLGLHPLLNRWKPKLLTTEDEHELSDCFALLIERNGELAPPAPDAGRIFFSAPPIAAAMPDGLACMDACGVGV